MRATVMYGAGDVRIENVPDAHLIEPTDAVVHVTRAAICGSDLWPYKTMEHSDSWPPSWGTSSSASSRQSAPTSAPIKVGDLVVAPFLYSDGTCVFCHEGLHLRLPPRRALWLSTASTEDKARRCASPRRTGHSSSCRSAKTTR